MLRCLYFNARSVVRKLDDLQVLAADKDLIAVTETWLKPTVMDCEVLPGTNCNIFRKDRTSRPGGGVMLVVRDTITCFRRQDLEGDSSEVLFCEIRPNNRRKLLVAVYYRPPDSSLEYLKELKASLRLAHNAKFDQLILCGDFNLPNIDWATGTSKTNDAIENCFTKLVRDNYLWQLVDFPTRISNTLDLILTNVPEKVKDVYGYDDVISTDHKLISFSMDFNTPKKLTVKRNVFDYKRTNWNDLNEALSRTLGFGFYFK
ncbi:uncharacterized protein LOC114541681 [Dendronephthya gigantea]|uniref:uncharacterized protein LOC114541681 n=1 Tax=Dendronephthya gigantea TaxID=151771 RepID=UPI00106C4718|nr:uncharacterized protein LOC114541681 [Dendronephthya gigantea]